jgi:hypothetical protein
MNRFIHIKAEAFQSSERGQLLKRAPSFYHDSLGRQGAFFAQSCESLEIEK